jgi:hypothetical protein
LVGGIEHKMEPGVGHKAAVVARKEEPVVNRDSFGMEVALHTGWVGEPVLQVPSHSSCKSVDQQRSSCRMLGSDVHMVVT